MDLWITKNDIVNIYHKRCTALQFERAGLFDLVQETFHGTQVLYHGCFVHIFRFIAQDFTAPLPLPQESFKLLISIFASGVAEVYKGYLNPDSLLLTNRSQEVTNIDFEAVKIPVLSR